MKGCPEGRRVDFYVYRYLLCFGQHVRARRGHLIVDDFLPGGEREIFGEKRTRSQPRDPERVVFFPFLPVSHRVSREKISERLRNCETESSIEIERNRASERGSAPFVRASPEQKGAGRQLSRSAARSLALSISNETERVAAFSPARNRALRKRVRIFARLP